MRPSFKSLENVSYSFKSPHLGLFWCWWHVFLAGFWHSMHFQVWWGWKMLQPCEANSLLPLHTTWDVSSDCSKVTPSTQILPSLVGAHNSTLPDPPLPIALPSCLSILFVYSAACLVQWLVHPHLLHSYPQTWHRQAAATVSSLLFLLGIVFCAQSFCCCGLLLILGCDHCVSDCRNVFIVLRTPILTVSQRNNEEQSFLEQHFEGLF